MHMCILTHTHEQIPTHSHSNISNFTTCPVEFNLWARGAEPDLIFPRACLPLSSCYRVAWTQVHVEVPVERTIYREVPEHKSYGMHAEYSVSEISFLRSNLSQRTNFTLSCPYSLVALFRLMLRPFPPDTTSTGKIFRFRLEEEEVVALRYFGWKGLEVIVLSYCDEHTRPEYT